MQSDSNADESESGAIKKGELTGYTDGLHSPFGVIGQIMDARGITLKQALWAEPFSVIVLSIADQPRYVKRPPAPVAESTDDIKKILGR